jgi:hypothetical protein
VFLINSRLGLFTATFSPHVFMQLLRYPFSQSYGVSLPSSLTRVLPLALGFSPRLPVSVCSTGTLGLARGFSRQYGVSCFVTCSFTPLHTSAMTWRICLPGLPLCLDALYQPRAQLTLLRHPLALTALGGTGISTSCPSPTHALPRLRPRLTLSGRAFLRKP